MKITSIRALAFLKTSLLGVVLFTSAVVQSEDKSTAGAVAKADASVASKDDLAKKLANPIAAMISIPFQNNFDFGGGPNGDGVQWKMNFQPVIPLTINEDWNLITRTIIPVISQKDVIGTTSQSGLSDTVFSAWLSPVKPTSGGWIWGLGVAGLLPTGTNDFLTANQWGVGPTAIVLKQADKFTYGMLINQIWSADTPSDRSSVNQMFVQPFISYLPGGGWTFALNTESVCDFSASQWTVPINLMVNKMIKIGKMPAQVQLGGRYYPEAPENGPDWGLRLSLTLLLPR